LLTKKFSLFNRVSFCRTILISALHVVFLVVASSSELFAQFVPGVPLLSFISFRLGISGLYADFGYRYRNIETLRIVKEKKDISYNNPGVPPFGPNVPGPFGTGTGVKGYPTNPNVQDPDPNLSGIWLYNNGSISAAAPTASYGVSGNLDYPQGSAVMLGRFVNEQGSQAYNVGSFQINDTYLQVDNPGGKVSQTARVTWSRLIDGSYPLGSNEIPSLLLQGQDGAFDLTFAQKGWTPMFEIGFQGAGFYDVYYGFSVYDLNCSMSAVQTIDADVGVRGFNDTFSFYSNLPNTWRLRDFNSASSLMPCGEVTANCRSCGKTCNTDTSVTYCNNGCTPNGGQEGNGGCPDCPSETLVNYRIWPDGPGQGVFPVRQFFDNFPADAPKQNLVEELKHSVDVKVYESRVAGRSWVPVLRLGRIGAGFGFILNQMEYTISSARLIKSSGLPAPDLPIQPLETNTVTGTWWNVGMFAGAEFALSLRGFVARSSIEYNLCKNQSLRLMNVETTVNPGGLSAAFSGGFVF
jgi:hypothetical protein